MPALAAQEADTVPFTWAPSTTEAAAGSIVDRCWAEKLLRRRERWGISYATINSGCAEPFAAIAGEVREAGG
ncbi:hypothetical protein AB0M80_24410 [Amycolatopsis sp. NPDC051045]|uniref:hypothetical protein n=1 Tax=Amycolatopsis sp. NPDC051045 TaxID=3156922 RepID=UPI003421F241